MKGYAPGWQVRCVKCGHVRDAGEAGLVRIGAWSWKKYIVGRCPNCRWVWIQAVERQTRAATDLVEITAFWKVC